MNVDNVSIVFSTTSLIALITMIYHFTRKLSILELKVDTMWSFQVRRAFSEVVEKGYGEVRSPLKFNEEVKNVLKPIEPSLIEFWVKEGHKLDDAEALLAIECKFGDQLLKIACIPHKLSHGACLLLALTIAKGKNEIHLF